MDKTVLVIGSVTADQYREASLSVLKKSDQPKVVRLQFDEFFLGSEALLAKWATSEEKSSEEIRGHKATNLDESTRLMSTLANRHYSSFGDIATIVMDQETWDKWDPSAYPQVIWMIGAHVSQSEYAQRWVALPGGRVEHIF